MADATVLKTVEGDLVRVRLPSSAPISHRSALIDAMFLCRLGCLWVGCCQCVSANCSFSLRQCQASDAAAGMLWLGLHAGDNFIAMQRTQISPSRCTSLAGTSVVARRSGSGSSVR